jgi:hypothetical protein
MTAFQFHFCASMTDAIVKQFFEIRQNSLVSLITNFSNPECLFHVNQHKVFKMTAKSVLEKTAKTMM